VQHEQYLACNQKSILSKRWACKKQFRLADEKKNKILTPIEYDRDISIDFSRL